MLSIGFHSFIDGVIYSITFNVSILTGVLAAVGMVLHEFPEGIVTFVLLERAGFSRRRSTLYAFLAAALSTPLDTLVAYLLSRTSIAPLWAACLPVLQAPWSMWVPRTCYQRLRQRTRGTQSSRWLPGC